MARGGRGRGPTCARAERGWAPQQLQQSVGAGIWAGLWPPRGGACTGAGLDRVLARWGGGASEGGTWTGLGLVGSWLAGGGAWPGRGAGHGRGRGRGSPEEGRSLGRAEEPAGRGAGGPDGRLERRPQLQQQQQQDGRPAARGPRLAGNLAGSGGRRTPAWPPAPPGRGPLRATGPAA